MRRLRSVSYTHLDVYKRQQEKAARAEAKAQKKADRKKAKELNDDLDMDDETSTGGKIAVFFVTLIIILIWLAIIVLLIKCDVGGFGSSVLAPVLKDVPYVNKILPDSATEEVSTEDEMCIRDSRGRSGNDALRE